MAHSKNLIYKKGLVLLNIGEAKTKNELEVFLTNFYNDKNIIRYKNNTIRSMVASFLTLLTLNKIWKKYQTIEKPPSMCELTDQLVKKLELQLPDYFVTEAMRYTSPFSQTAIARLKEKKIKNIVLLPLYPHYSVATVQSSIDDFLQKATFDDFDLEIVPPFYHNETYNKAVCDEIIRVQGKYNDFHLIFSAHGVSKKLLSKGDPYQKQLEEHIEILKEKLTYYATNIQSINLAYQSRVLSMRWQTPSLEKMLKHFKGKKVIIYPISFIIDNSHNSYELEVKYKEIAKKIGIKEYRVCRCVNDNETFVEAIQKMF